MLVARLGDHLPADWASPAALSDAIGQARGPAAAEDRDTTHLSVVDAAGMRVALTQSIGPHFGARVADPETGILIPPSYRMAEAPAPGARDVTEQCPCLLDIGAARYALGGAGSERIPGAVAAVAGSYAGGALSFPPSCSDGTTVVLPETDGTADTAFVAALRTLLRDWEHSTPAAGAG